MLADDWECILRVAQGYKPSGYNIVPTAGLDAKPFMAEKSINYELGTRYETADVTLQAAAFFIPIPKTCSSTLVRSGCKL